MKKLSPRVWRTLVLVGLVGQFAWTIENMYFNVYLYNTISTDPGYISAMVGWSAAAATLTTLLMGALSDRVGKRKLFICGGYLLWGLSTAAFGLVTVENAAKLFPAAAATAAAAVMIVVLDCVMTFFGSTANDAAFNAYVTDITDNSNRGRAESVLTILPLISMLIIFGAFDGLTQQGRWQEFFNIFFGKLGNITQSFRTLSRIFAGFQLFYKQIYIRMIVIQRFFTAGCKHKASCHCKYQISVFI